jgi:hypothetical protein
MMQSQITVDDLVAELKARRAARRDEPRELPTKRFAHLDGFLERSRSRVEIVEGCDDEGPEPQAAKPKRPSISTLIRQARKAGERGAVRVELIGANGSRTIVTSSSEPTAIELSDDDAEKLWHERIDRAAH